MAKSRAIHRYKYGKHKGKTVPQKEIIRRVEQSLLATGRLRPMSQPEMPQEGNLVAGVGTTMTKGRYQAEQEGHTTFVEDPTQKLKDEMQDSDKGTINIA